MRLMGEKTEFKNSTIIYAICFAVIGILSFLYLNDIIKDEKWSTIISGLLTGLIVAVVQLAISWREFQKMDKYDSLRIKDILHRRNDRNYYKNMILGAKVKIRVQGVTAQRFLHDFANPDDTEEGGKALLQALAKGVEVRILVASPDNLTQAQDKKKAEIVKDQLEKLSKNNKGFKYAFYKHEPTHSIVTIDDESIVGPIFPKLASEHTPAIHLENDSKYVQKYLEYFKEEWKTWSSDNEVLQD